MGVKVEERKIIKPGTTRTEAACCRNPKSRCYQQGGHWTWIGSGQFRAVASARDATTGQGKRRYSVLFPTKGEAEKHAKKWRADLAAKHGRFASAQDGAPTFTEYAAEWVARAGLDRRQATVENYEQFVTRYLGPAFGAEPITAITPKALRAFITRVRAPGGSRRFKDRGLSSGSLRIGLACLRQILDDAVADEILTVNPFAGIGRRVVGRTVKRPIDPFDPAELRALFGAADALDATGTWGTWLRLWAGCGARRGETQAWRWDGLALDAGTIAITQTFSKQRLGPPKTPSSVRVSKFLHPVSEATAEWRAGGTAENAALLHRLKVLKVAAGGAPFLFGGTEPAPLRLIEYRWDQTVAAARVRRRSVETLRHSFASISLSRGAPLVYVQAVGGWSSGVVLLQSYSRFLPGATGDDAPAALPARQEAEPGRVKST
jgi:integrase